VESISTAALTAPLKTAGRAGGRRFGILVHAILRELDLGGTPAQIAALAEVHARLLDAPRAETEAAAAAVEATWAHPLLERARAADRSYRELPVDLRLDNGQLLEGVIDLAFLELDRWVVVDFKTDTIASTRYERQLQWYVYALAKLTGRAATGHLLQV
jgi:ATP-dependent helicase/nuclease subunit A